MKKALKATLLLLAISIVIGGCQRSANENSENRMTNTAGKTVENSNASTGEPPKKEVEAAPGGSLVTPTDAYKTAYAARERKDYDGLKRTLSKDVLAFLADIGEAEHKTLEEEIKQMFEKPQAKTAEVRNEKIKGDKAMLEYLDEKGGWKWMDFVKEGNEWKLTLPGPDTPTDEGPAKQK